VVRWLSATELGWDLTVQIQAAQNLLAGRGLSYYGPVGPDLAEPAQLFTLTDFSCGYTVFAAALIALGANVGVMVRVLGTAGTMLGWWGWGKLASPFFRDGLHYNPVWRGAGFAIAIVSPLLFIPPWGGTDIFLWAAVPWVLAWVVRAADEHVPGGKWLDGLAGAVCGLCMLLRYASLFLVVYAAGLMLWQSRLRLLVLMRRWAFFGLGLLPALALQVYIIRFLANAPVRLGGSMFNYRLGFVVRRAWHGVPLLSTATYPWVFWLPRVEDWFSQMAGRLTWQLGLTLAVLVVLVLVVRTYGLSLAAVAQDLRTVGLGLFVVLPLFLWGCMMFGDYDYVADRRYYWPILPLSVFVVYSFTFLAGVMKRSGLSRPLHIFGMVYLTGYIAVSLACIGLFFMPGKRGSGPRAMLMRGSDIHHPESPPPQRVPLVRWPSMAMTYEFSPARQFVMERLKEQPNTLLLASRDLWKWFMVDPAVDQARLYSLACNRLRAKYLSGPARIVILSFDNGEPQELWNYLSHANPVRRERADCFERLPARHLLQRFPEEGLMVLETQVPAGIRVSFSES
jgi:hypothetical protein